MGVRPIRHEILGVARPTELLRGVLILGCAVASIVISRRSASQEAFGAAFEAEGTSTVRLV